MAISETQKVDYLWKKLAYGLSKTDTNANKRATNESIASPLLLRGENVWAQSSLVPGVIPGSSTGVVTVYPTSSPDETTADSSATLNRTWKTGLTDWISPEYGSTYLVKVYIHTAGQPGSAASSGTQVFGAGSGNNDEWFFDYQSGILHFIGTNLPSGISGKSIYVSGARYTGIKGVAVPGAGATFTALNVSGITTFVDNVQISSLTDNRIAIVGSGSTIEDDANLTFDGSTLAVGVDLDIDGRTELDITNIAETLNVVGISTFTSNVDLNADLDVDGRTELDITNISETLNVVGVATFASAVDINNDLDVDGRTELDITNISETLNVVGVSTFSSDIDINASIDVDGHTELDDVNVSTALTANNLVVTGSTLLSHSNSLKLQTTGIGVSISNGVGLTATIAGPTNLIIDPGVVGDNTGIVRIKGDLFVDGTQTQINSTTIELADFIVGVATTATSDLLTDGAGIQIGPNNTFLYEFNGGTNPSLKSSENLNVASGKVYQIDQTERLSADTLSLGTGTTIHSPASNVLTLGTNGTEALRIASNGKVGVGTDATPNFSLDVQDIINIRKDGSNLAILQFQAHSTKLEYSDATGHLSFYTNSTERGYWGYGGGLNVTSGGLDVTGHTELDITNISETLNVTGIATFASNVDLNADLDVDGHTELDNVNVSGVTTTGGLLDINAGAQANTLKVEDLSDNRVVIAGTGGELEDDANLTFNGSTLAVGVNLDIDGRTELDITNISETLNVVGIATFVNNIDANGDLDVDGHTELDHVNVSAASTFAGLVDINAGAQANTLKVENLTDNRIVLAGTGGELEDSANLTFDGTTLALTGNQTVSGTIDVDGQAIFDDITVSAASTFTGNIDANGNLDVDGQTELDNVNVSGIITATESDIAFLTTKNYSRSWPYNNWTSSQQGVTLATTGKNLIIQAGGAQTTRSYVSLTNGGGAWIGGGYGNSEGVNIDAGSGDVKITGGNVGIGSIQPTANLDVNGQTELDELNVTGISTFENDVNVGGALSVTGNAFFVGMVTFAAGADGNIVLGDAATDNVVFNADVNSNIIPNTNNAYDLGSSSQEWKDLYLNGIAYIDTLQVHEGSTFTGNIDANGDLDVDGHTELDNLNVSGVSTFASAVDINANLDVDGHTELDNLNVSGVSTFASAVDINADLDVDGRTELDTTNISETLNVTGISTFASNVDLNADLDVDGRTELDNVNISETLNVVGVSTFAGRVAVGTDATPNFSLDVQDTIQIRKSSGNLAILQFSAHSTKLQYNDATGHLSFYTNSTERGYWGYGGGLNVTSGGLNVTSGGLDVTGHTELDTLNVSGVSTFASAVDINASIDVDGHTELDNLKVTGVSTFTNNAIFDSTNSIQIPVGTEAQKDAVGTAVTGQIRFNTTNAQFEGFGVGNNWGSLGGVKDVDGDTFITAEESAGNDDDTLNFHTAGSVRVAISSTGQVGIGSTIPAATLDVLGNTRLVGILTVTGGIDGIGIQSEGTSITTGIVTTLNFVGNGVSSITNTNGLVEIDIKGGTFTKNTTSFTATAGQTTFSLTYTPNFIDVYHNGVKLTTSEFTATNGTSVVLSEGAFVGDTIDIVVFQNSGLFDSSKWSLVDAGNQSGDIFKNTNVGIGTAIPTDAAHSSNTKILNVGVVTANTIYGALIGSVTGTITGTADLAEGLTGSPNISVGIITADSISVAGTITYNDVTNVDSIGIITARSDVHVGTALSVAGISTFTGLVDINGGGQANTFKVEDLTDNRVVIVGTGGELEDDNNFTFDGTRLALGVGLTVSGVSTFANNIDANGDLDVDGHTELDNLKVTGFSTFTSIVDINADLDVDGHTNLDHVIVSLASTFSDRVIFDSTNSIQIPVGTEAQKDAVGTAVTGQIRFNTTNAQFEGFGVGNNWGSLGGVKDVDGDTFIRAESAAGQDEDELQFITGNTNRVVITSGGSVGVGSTIPVAKVDLEGVLGLESTITTVSSTSATTIDTLPITTYRSAKFQIQITQGTSYQTADLLVIHDGSIASSIEYASLSTGEELAVFTTTISGSNLLLQTTMSNASSATVKVVRYGVTI